jgi:hypothetical protein
MGMVMYLCRWRLKKSSFPINFSQRDTPGEVISFQSEGRVETMRFPTFFDLADGVARHFVENKV